MTALVVTVRFAWKESGDAMGNTNRKVEGSPDAQTGLTASEVKVIQETWRHFCKEHREYGALVFLSMFVKHPEYLKLFKNFRGKPVTVLKDDPVFRAHGCSIGYHITSMVESIHDPPTFEVLVRRNATEHLQREGVMPHHFEVMGQCLVDVLQAMDERHMTPAAISAWGKFLACMLAIIKDVYDKAADERDERASMTSAASIRTMDDAALTPPFGTADSTEARSPERLETPMTSPTTVQSGASVTVTALSKKKPPRKGSKKGGAKKESKSCKADSEVTSTQDKSLTRTSTRRKAGSKKKNIPLEKPS